MFSNRVEITVKSQEGEVLHSYAKDNVISDDFLATNGRIFFNNTLNSFNGPFFSPIAFLLPDGTQWASYPGWDARNPWAPYTCTLNNSLNSSASTLQQGLNKNGYNTNEAFNTSNLHNPVAANQYRWRMFYTWNQLPTDIQLKAVGLTALQSDIYSGISYGSPANATPSNFCPQTLVIIPTSFLVHGLVGATNVPDVLEVSYFISVVGAA
jgi:hypothetical protein